MIMTRELLRLLKSHEFLKRALDEHEAKLSHGDATGLKGRIDRVFLDILVHASDDPRVTLTQVRFLLSNLVVQAGETEMSVVLREICERHMDRFEDQISALSAAAPTQSMEFRYLDSLSDRVAVIDAEYRYVFTNRANAEFHGKAASNFVGCPNWRIVGESYFERYNKARFDNCLAGQSSSFFATHPVGGPTKIFSSKCEPVRNPDGSVSACLVTARDVTGLPIPAELIEPRS